MAIAATSMAALATISCGGDSSAPSGPPANSNRVVIAQGGRVSPTEIVVAPGTRILFVNEDGQPHFMASDPHPDHFDCPDINQVGLLGAGVSRETGNMVAVRTCGFHDHNNPASNNLRGRIVVR
jgi:plastocyanin